jgi:glycosyltransferase involved in cell wall biosynthesis
LPTFLIVTPSFNSARFIDETILSVLSQKGEFRIRYHIQDGGSKDDTLHKLEAWKNRLAAGQFPVLCEGIEFTFCSQQDQGMYDAINRGFDHLEVREEDYQTYINSDDLILPGALQFAAGRFDGSPALDWLGGRPCELNERGEMMRIHQEQVYPTASLRAGLHDGRQMRFVMQEGTFWRGRLWKKAGAFRPHLRQAGDWDLWRRFAHHADYVTTDMILAGHRRSRTQLTADMAVYDAEVDAVIRQDIGDLHQAELERFRQWSRRSVELWDRRFFGTILRFKMDESRGGNGAWEPEERPYSMPLKASALVTNGITALMLPAQFEKGFGAENASDAALNLPAGYRTATAHECVLRFDAGRDALHRVFMRCRSFEPGTHLKLMHRTRMILNKELPVTGYGWDCVVIAEAVFTAGENLLALTISGRDPDKLPYIIFVSCEAMSTL